MAINWLHLLQQTTNLNLTDHLIYRHIREGRSQRPALSYHGKIISYGELAHGVAKTSEYLAEQGLGACDRVLLLIKDNPEFVISFFSVISRGAVAVLANPLLEVHDLQYMADHTQANMLIYGRSESEKAGIISMHGVSIPCDDFGQIESGEQIIDDAFEVTETGISTIAYVLFSSGTTGKPKAIPRRHGDILHCAHAFGEQILDMRETDIVLAVPKLTFGYALGSLLFSLNFGACSVIFPDQSTAESIAYNLIRNAITVFAGTPRVIGELLKKGQDDALRELRIATTAGETLPPSILQAWRNCTAAPLLDGFGSTEAGHIFLSNAPDTVTAGASGKCLACFRTKLIDDHGNDVAEGEVGRMCVAGPSVASEYLNDHERSSEAFCNGWHISNDLFVCRNQVYTYIGRADDMIKKGCGEWISPYEIEDELLKNESILECAVVGSKMTNGIIALKAYVVCNEGAIVSQSLVDSIIEDVRQRWSDFPHKHIDEVEFLEGLPRNTAGKIQRHLLRQQTLTEFSYDC